mmetsp:Transcript_1139/g.3522  ORF Transcript_1139/g.3522 Transcript_1139/m.3522 type:complete len:535 (+) Transcript_1139:348-1952(+)
MGGIRRFLGIWAMVCAAEKSSSTHWTWGISCFTVLTMPQTVTAETPVMCVGTCSPVMRPFTPQVVTTIGILATSPLAMVATRSPNSTQTCVGTLSERFWPKMMECEGARSIASTVGSCCTILGMPQYLREATAGSRSSLGTTLSVIGELSGPVEGGGPLPAGRVIGRLGVCLRYSAAMERASSMVCFRISSLSASPTARKCARASRAYLRPSSRSARLKQAIASVYMACAAPKESPAASKSASASLPSRRPSELPTSVERMALARTNLAAASSAVLPASTQSASISVAVSMAMVGLPWARYISATDLREEISAGLLPVSFALLSPSFAIFMAAASSCWARLMLTIVRRTSISFSLRPALLQAASASCAEDRAASSPFASCTSASATAASTCSAPAPAALKRPPAFESEAAASLAPPSLLSWTEAMMYIAAPFFFWSSTLPTIWSATESASSTSPLARLRLTTARRPPASPSLSPAARKAASASMTSFCASSASFIVKYVSAMTLIRKAASAFLSPVAAESLTFAAAPVSALVMW